MRNVPAIARKEAAAFFYSPVAYIIMTLALLACGFLFWSILQNTGQATLRHFVRFFYLILIVVCPLLTMRLLSEEARSGTLESFMTAPVTESEIVLGKFVGVYVFYVFLLSPTLALVAILLKVGRPDLKPLAANYCGLLLSGASFLSVGILASSLTRNQIAAAILGLASLAALWVVGFAAAQFDTAISGPLAYACIETRLASFAVGIVDTRDLVYHLSLTSLLLFLSVKSVEIRRWRQ